MKYYKVLDFDGSSCHGGIGLWHLPKGERPGEWMPVLEDLVPCHRGYHVCRPKDLLCWLGPRIFLIEIRGKKIIYDDKVVVEQARLVRETSWDDSSARLFAADCAEHVLHLWTKEFPQDDRPQRAIDTARRYVRGECTNEELSAARAAVKAAAEAVAWDAAWAVARDAARDAARAAAWTAARAAGSAAGSAAWTAARDAARAAAGAVVKDAVGAAAWDVAWDVAWDAAWAAAGSAVKDVARDVAWDAAWAAAGSAVKDVARDAAGIDECKWQTRRLLRYLTPEA